MEGLSLSLLVQTAVLLVGIGITFGVLRADIKGQGTRLNKVENDMEKMQSVMVMLARQEERHNSMQASIVAQAQQLAAQAALINGRLEAINNIVAAHTAQLHHLNARPSQA